MLGYELITAIEERSGGRWRPSPGAVYPALAKLEERGVITSEDDDGKRQYSITDRGRELLDTLNDAEDGAPWDRTSAERGGELRRTMAELIGPIRQIGRFGSTEQRAAAEAVLKNATAQLYQILADPPPAAAPTDEQPDDQSDEA